MEKEELTAYIVQRLSKGIKPTDLVLDVCEKANLTWPEAKQFVNQVQENKGSEITRKQFPLLFCLALVIFLAGLGLIGYGVFTLLSEISEIQANLVPIHTASQNIDVFRNIYLTLFTIYQISSGPIFSIIFGAAMLLGSLVGMRDEWSSILYGTA